MTEHKGKKSKEKPFKFFIDECMKIFGFLADDYNMEILDPEIYGFECSVTFRRYKELAITITYEAGAMPWVEITAVLDIDGVPKNEICGLHYLVEERCPHLKINSFKFSEKYREEMTGILLQYARILKECCTDVLEGDFSIMPRILARQKAYEIKLREEDRNS